MDSCDPFPRLVQPNRTNVRLCYPKTLGNFLLTSDRVADSPYIIHNQLACWRRSMSLLGDHIGEIVSLRAEPKVLWIDAERVITCVAYFEFSWVDAIV